MDYWPSEDQDLIQSSFREFLAAECDPGHVREYYDGGGTFDEPLWKSIKELGFAGTCIPTEFGGSELGLMEAALVSEELGRHSVPVFLEGHTLAGLAITRGGTAEQKTTWLPKLASGDAMGSLALASDRWCDWQVAPEDGGAATVSLVPNADVADVLVVGCKGGRLGVLDTSTADLTATNLGGIDQSRALFEVSFDAGAVELLPDLGGETLCDALLGLLAADAFGAADKLVEMSVAYAMQREQFGQPIAQFQAVKHKLADLALGSVTGRGLFWRAAQEFDADAASFCRSASMAKAHLGDQAFQIGREAVELHGGVGLTWECDVQFSFKRAMFDRTYLGTPDEHRKRCAELAGWIR